ncbi:MAG: hypothetical protein FD189_1289 [Elusimicrobia bacterium]|nr:MAG: hypothetical protein FD154_1513 [Elusimicrobiota bacterium]KAF0155696.1 MAG: hypothetical protein FD189_1289 [Elusimicrobiota bacterium]
MNPPARERNIRVALDANILITLLNMNRLGLLAELKGYDFYVPDQVVGEIHRRVQRERLRGAIRAGWLKEIDITDLAEIGFYASYRRRFGEGESACLAVGRKRGWMVATDDRAVKREVAAALGGASLLDTGAILAIAVKRGLLTGAELKEINENFSF